MGTELRLVRAVAASLFALMAIVSVEVRAEAQNGGHGVTVRAVDGRNGRPFKNSHLLIFGGSSPQELFQHAEHFDLHTNEHGIAKLAPVPKSLRFLQVWVDGATPCDSSPNTVALSLEQILRQGLSAPNSCSSLREPAEPRQLLIFARPATLAEKMRR